MKMMSLAIAAAMLGVPGVALADAPEGVSGVTFTGGDGTSGYPGTLGYRFTATSANVVNGLGYWDQGLDGLAASHDLGLWDLTTNTLVRTATVGSGTVAALLDGFRYVDVAAYTLTAGSSYAVGGYDGDNTDLYAYYTSVTAAPGITYDSSAYSFDQALTQPTFYDGNNGYFGANIRLAAAVSSVPEPATWAMMLVGFGAVGGTMRRRKSKVTTSVAYA